MSLLFCLCVSFVIPLFASYILFSFCVLNGVGPEIKIHFNNQNKQLDHIPTLNSHNKFPFLAIFSKFSSQLFGKCSCTQ